jgi:hemoglobin-like flavoprotein
LPRTLLALADEVKSKEARVIKVLRLYAREALAFSLDLDRSHRRHGNHQQQALPAAAAMKVQLTPKQIDLIRESFDAIWPVRRKVSQQFYGKVFELAPDARRLFSEDMERQHLKLMDMIAAIVGALDQSELFQSLVIHSGRQHARFEVTPSQYSAFGEALIWSLEQQLGSAFDAEVKEAWVALYGKVSENMIRAAN